MSQRPCFLSKVPFVGFFPNLRFHSSFHSPTLASWNHLQNKPASCKFSSQCPLSAVQRHCYFKLFGIMNWSPGIVQRGLNAYFSTACQCRLDERDVQVWFLSRVDPLRSGKWQTYPVFLPGESHREGAWQAIQCIGSHRVKTRQKRLSTHTTLCMPGYFVFITSLHWIPHLWLSAEASAHRSCTFWNDAASSNLWEPVCFVMITQVLICIISYHLQPVLSTNTGSF